MPSGKREAASFHELGALAAAQPEEMRTRRTDAEATYSGILGRLGAEGTYDKPGSTTPSQIGEGGGSATDIFKTEKVKSGPATGIDLRYTKKSSLQDITSLDPDKAVKAQEGTTQFRIMSRLTAEAEQLISREGPLYQEMLNNLQLPILEGAGVMARENAEALKRAAARGGSARRGAMEAVQKMRSQEKINSQKVMAISQTRFAMDQWARQNARGTLEFGQSWAANLGGIRETYQAGMDQASQLMINGALPIMFDAKQEAAKWRNYAHQKNRAKVTRWIDGIVGVIAMAGGAYLKSPELMGAGAGMIGGATAGVQAPGSEA
jgi:hypothetical protein